MRRLVIALLASTALVGTASAADLARKSVVSAPVVMAPNWTGFYVGGFIGYGWGSNDWSLVDNWNNWGGLSNDFDGFLGGAQIGYDYQFNNMVIGIQADITGASLEDKSWYLDEYYNNEASWIATVTGRLGFVADRALFYIKGGAAWADHDSSWSWIGDYYSSSGTRSGWTVGAGIEYAFAPNWTMFLEYDYYDFGDKNYYFPALDTTVKVDTDVSAVKIGVNYRFGGPSAVSARY
ncbi:outer membrane protein [Blastochloris tepida]|uniref:Membrane protein n=1 Tax=Blastochloris tepida TaxID=2233851 RepID=A0A348G174_9HYPH|nr:outer membrane protein [Blastochloris tepida]BBF93307.1 membrane protein [Blastochloris tepida]